MSDLLRDDHQDNMFIRDVPVTGTLIMIGEVVRLSESQSFSIGSSVLDSARISDGGDGDGSLSFDDVVKIADAENTIIDGSLSVRDSVGLSDGVISPEFAKVSEMMALSDRYFAESGKNTGDWLSARDSASSVVASIYRGGDVLKISDTPILLHFSMINEQAAIRDIVSPSVVASSVVRDFAAVSDTNGGVANGEGIGFASSVGAISDKLFSMLHASLVISDVAESGDGYFGSGNETERSLAWSANSDNWAVSRYILDGWKDLAVIDGALIGFSDNGIYMLDGGHNSSLARNSANIAIHAAKLTGGNYDEILYALGFINAISEFNGIMPKDIAVNIPLTLRACADAAEAVSSSVNMLSTAENAIGRQLDAEYETSTTAVMKALSTAVNAKNLIRKSFLNGIICAISIKRAFEICNDVIRKVRDEIQVLSSVSHDDDETLENMRNYSSEAALFADTASAVLEDKQAEIQAVIGGLGSSVSDNSSSPSIARAAAEGHDFEHVFKVALESHGLEYINSKIVTGKVDIGGGILAHPVGAYMEYELSDGESEMVVSTTQGGAVQSYSYKLVDGKADELTNGRFIFGRGLRGRHFKFELRLNGVSGHIHDLRIDASATKRRI
nr:MAG TPA: hypothetical protein [Caudoviricetes sp.]